MNTEDVNKNKIQLAFPKYEENDEYISKGVLVRVWLSICLPAWMQHKTGLDSTKQSIEKLWIGGLIERGGITKLIVSAKGEGGMKAVLKQKPQH